MNSTLVLPLVSFVLVTLCLGGVLVAMLYPRVTGGSALDRKRAAIAGQRGLPTTASRDGSTRKRSVEDTLKEAVQEQAAAAKSPKPTLRTRMRQAGLTWTNQFYWAVCVGIGGLMLLLGLVVFKLGVWPATGSAISSGLLLPHLYVTRRRNKRFKKFTDEFPTATDLIVRGIRSGLPVVDCLKIVSAEAQEPVKSEFRAMVEDQTLGVPLEEAVQRMAERVPIAPARFFAIVIAIQSRTGGNLSEAISNLSKVLRERKKMEAKVKSVSSEAKASASIIGSLPIAVAALVYLTSPAYISLLFATTIGNAVLVFCAIWMFIGSMIMRKMINFDI